METAVDKAPVVKIKETRIEQTTLQSSTVPGSLPEEEESNSLSLRPAYDFASAGAGAGRRGFCVSAQNLAISSLATRVRSGEPSMWTKASTNASRPGSAGSSP